MERSRTKNSIINMSSGFFLQIFTTILKFITQTVFIKCLSTEYLGLNGLFTNILTMLSFAELGIGNAIVYAMYKEIADENVEKIKSLMHFYKKTYTKIGIVVLIIGLSITPFINHLITGTPNIKENIYIIYIFFLFNTSVSYFFTYKKSIIQAYQKGYLVDFCKFIVEIIKTILQIIILYIYNNYMLYLSIQIICTVLDNILASHQADKLFVFLKDENVKKISKDEEKSIFTNVKSLLMYKFGSVILNGTDNVIISKLLGLTFVGLISNYNLLINTVNTVVGNALNGFIASIGNLNAQNDTYKQRKIFNQILFLCAWIYGFCGIAFFVLANNFIVIWIGEEYILSLITVFMISLQFYVNGTQFAGYSYRTTFGLFKKGKYYPIISACINIILSILLGKIIGITGIILATVISRLATTTWYDIYIVFNMKFNLSPLKIYYKYFKYIIIVLLNGMITYNIVNLVEFTGIISFVIQILICITVPNFVFFLFFYRTEEFKEIFSRIKSIFFERVKITKKNH